MSDDTSDDTSDATLDPAAVRERYERLADAFAATIDAVPEDRWTAPSPCEDWTARDVVRHVVGTQAMFLGFVGQDAPEVPDVDDDPAGAWAAASAPIRARLADRELAGATFDGMFGTTTFATAVDSFLCTDLVVHRWDLATAAGLPTEMDAAEVARVQAQVERFGDALRGPGAFKDAVEPPEGADAQTRLLAFLGRRA
jgi:uncharacterized protein (TIGR03086 family)